MFIHWCIHARTLIFLRTAKEIFSALLHTIKSDPRKPEWTKNVRIKLLHLWWFFFVFLKCIKNGIERIEKERERERKDHKECVRYTLLYAKECWHLHRELLACLFSRLVPRMINQIGSAWAVAWENWRFCILALNRLKKKVRVRKFSHECLPTLFWWILKCAGTLKCKQFKILSQKILKLAEKKLKYWTGSNFSVPYCNIILSNLMLDKFRIKSIKIKNFITIQQYLKNIMALVNISRAWVNVKHSDDVITAWFHFSQHSGQKIQKFLKL